MTARPAHFTQATQDRFIPTANAQSHWGDDHLNGPALVGLVARVLEQAYGHDDFLPARLTVDLFKAARGVPISATTRLVRDGRRVRNSECELSQDGVVVVRGILVQYRRSAPPRGEEWSAAGDFTPPDDIGDAPFTCVGSDDAAWSPVIADHQNVSRKRMLNLATDAVQGSINSPFVNAAMAGEAASMVTNLGSAGVGYINGDLTVALARLPVDGWIGVQADSHWVADGISTGTATLFDRTGAFGSGLVTAISNAAAQIDFSEGHLPV